MVGDRLVQVNEHSMVGITYKMASDILDSTSDHVELHYERSDNTQFQVHKSSPGVFKSNSISQETCGDSYTDIHPYQERMVTFQRPEG